VIKVESEERPSRGSGDKSPWEPPTIRPMGTIALLVRGGSAHGKLADQMDGDMNQFLARGQQ
jgi:hypothetical protein